MTDIAKLITIDTQRFEITIDGIVFPWLIADLNTDAPPAIDLGGLLALRVGILADRIFIDGVESPADPPTSGYTGGGHGSYRLVEGGSTGDSDA